MIFLVKTTGFYCKWLQNDGALNFAQFFLDHSVETLNFGKLCIIVANHWS